MFFAARKKQDTEENKGRVESRLTAASRPQLGSNKGLNVASHSIDPKQNLKIDDHACGVGAAGFHCPPGGAGPQAPGESDTLPRCVYLHRVFGAYFRGLIAAVE